MNEILDRPGAFLIALLFTAARCGVLWVSFMVPIGWLWDWVCDKKPIARWKKVLAVGSPSLLVVAIGYYIGRMAKVW